MTTLYVRQGMREISYIVLLGLSCLPSATDAGVKLRIVENYGINGNRCLVLRDGRFCGILSGLNSQGEVVAVREVTLRISKDPIIEAYQSTFQGNGIVALYELNRHGGLVCLFAATAVDMHDDGAVFKNGRLDIGYEDRNGDGLPDILLSGVVERTGLDEHATRTRVPCVRVFYWVPDPRGGGSESAEGRFVEDVALRCGVTDEMLESSNIIESLSEEGAYQ